jgi:hypothetical protein
VNVRVRSRQERAASPAIHCAPGAAPSHCPAPAPARRGRPRRWCGAGRAPGCRRRPAWRSGSAPARPAGTTPACPCPCPGGFEPKEGRGLGAPIPMACLWRAARLQGSGKSTTTAPGRRGDTALGSPLKRRLTRPRGSKPKSPGRLPSRWSGSWVPGNQLGRLAVAACGVGLGGGGMPAAGSQAAKEGAAALAAAKRAARRGRGAGHSCPPAVAAIRRTQMSIGEQRALCHRATRATTASAAAPAWSASSPPTRGPRPRWPAATGGAAGRRRGTARCAPNPARGRVFPGRRPQAGRPSRGQWRSRMLAWSPQHAIATRARARARAQLHRGPEPI